MNRSANNKTVFIFILMFTWAWFLPVAAQQDAELLQNPGFELAFTDRGGEIERRVAESWEPWHVQRAEGDESWRNRQPGYLPASEETPLRVLSGSESQLIASEFLTHDGGVYQRVGNVPAAAQVTFTISAYVWSTTYRDPEVSEEPGGVFVQVGIDPTGGTDFNSTSIVWSTLTENYDGWNQYSISANITGTAATVWVRSIVEFPVQFNYVWLDDASLTTGANSGASGTQVVVAATPTPEGFEPATEAPATEAPTDDIGIIVPPTVTPPPTNTPFPTATAQPSSTPLALATFTPQPTATSEQVVVASPTPQVIGELPTNFPTSTGNPVFVVTATPEVIVITATTEPTPVPTDTPVVIVVTATTVPTNFPTETPSPTATATNTAEPSPTSELGIGGPLTSPLNEAFPGRIIHTVRRGDTVAELATLYSSTTEAIIEANGLDETALIFAGQGLIIPVRIANPATVTPTNTPLAPVQPSNPSVPPTGPVTSETLYVVQAGDTVSLIARRYNTTVAAIAQLNGIVNPNIIRVGQQLRVPGTGGTTAPVQPSQPAQPPAQRTYVVQPGDTLYRISLRFGVALSAIIQRNNISNPNRIFAGQVLVIP